MSTGCSSARFRVLVWGASGRKFESCHPDSDNQGLTRKCKSFCFILPLFYHLIRNYLIVTLYKGYFGVVISGYSDVRGTPCRLTADRAVYSTSAWCSLFSVIFLSICYIVSVCCALALQALWQSFGCSVGFLRQAQDKCAALVPIIIGMLANAWALIFLFCLIFQYFQAF